MFPLFAIHAAGCSIGPGPGQGGREFAPAAPPAHPFMLFGKGETAGLAQRQAADPLLADCWRRLGERAGAPDKPGDWDQLEARALLWQLGRDEATGQAAAALLRATLAGLDAAGFYANPQLQFDDQAEPLRALALAWDWLHERLTPAERAEVLPRLEQWCRAAYDHTEKQWWREASYNVGAIPVAGYGLLALSILGDSTDAGVRRCFEAANNFRTLARV